MNRFLILIFCVLCVQALKRRPPPDEEDVETSTFFETHTMPPGLIGATNFTDPNRLKKFQGKYGAEIERTYNEVYNEKDPNYSYLARIRFATTITIQCKFYLTFSFRLSITHSLSLSLSLDRKMKTTHFISRW